MRPENLLLYHADPHKTYEQKFGEMLAVRDVSERRCTTTTTGGQFQKTTQKRGSAASTAGRSYSESGRDKLLDVFAQLLNKFIRDLYSNRRSNAVQTQ